MTTERELLAEERLLAVMEEKAKLEWRLQLAESRLRLASAMLGATPDFLLESSLSDSAVSSFVLLGAKKLAETSGFMPPKDLTTAQNVIKCSAEVAKTLYENGLLFEINRRVLHPIGMAMSVIEQEDGSYYIGSLWKTGDVEGFIFEKSTFEEGFAKFEKFMHDAGLELLRKREEILGFIEQSESKEDI